MLAFVNNTFQNGKKMLIYFPLEAVLVTPVRKGQGMVFFYYLTKVDYYEPSLNRSQDPRYYQ
jgi:hypothetical protein